MSVRFADVSHSGKTDTTSTRTSGSIVWGTTKAKELVSGVRFSWDSYQNAIFADFLKAVGPNYKDADIEPLLYELDLDGYDNIRNKFGQSVYRLIKEKVMRKLKRTADKMEISTNFKSDIESSSIDPKHNAFDRKRDSIDPSVTSEYTKFTQPCHPFLKMPQQKVHDGNLKNATYENSTYMNQTSYPGSRNLRTSHVSHPPPQKNGCGMAFEEAKYKRARDSMLNLVLELSRIENVLFEAASAFNDLQPIKDGKKWIDVLNNLVQTYHDILLDGKELFKFTRSIRMES